jgi:hypothetical protein
MRHVTLFRMKAELLRLLQRRVASCAIGPSTARGMGPAGTIDAARGFLRAIDLSGLSATTSEGFPRFLDQQTDLLVKALPRGARHWGSARKFLNIFLRDVFYSRQLSRVWKLSHLESSLEVPLDSHVAFALRNEPEGSQLPRWRTVVGLTRVLSDRFQSVASAVARRHGTARVHLDLIYWRRERG